MAGNRARADFFRFLDYIGEKGLVPQTTAASRKATANKVLSILSDDEATDVISLDIDALMDRFHNLKGQNYTPESLQTYRSRLRTALEDFRAYCENPIAFKPSGQVRAKNKAKAVEDRPTAKNSGAAALKEARPIVNPTLPNVSVLPIAIRADLTIQIVGLPFDLSRTEAQKIANIVLAYGSEG